ncbi:porin family protein [Spirosoma spitsbergense]|jgi:hypothetical protein|uniref:porin family protein n=1 Tax=Spirosoma spitsbergense TaxID=431554 RepID=UPI0003AAE766|nr:porin family protein [Spirosoma spitsbergense]
MHKIYQSFLLVFITIMTSFGQVRVGATAGFQLAIHTPEDVGTQNKSKAGFMAGAMLEIPLSSGVSLRPQLLYSAKGVKRNVLGTFDAALSLNYIEVPIQLVYTVESGTGHLSFGAGVYIAYGLSSKAVITSKGQSRTFTDDFGPAADQFQRNDIGGRLSIDYELASGLTIGTYYAPGFTDINNPSAASSGVVATHNSALGISVGYWLKKR